MDFIVFIFKNTLSNQLIKSLEIYLKVEVQTPCVEYFILTTHLISRLVETLAGLFKILSNLVLITISLFRDILLTHHIPTSD